MRIIILGSDGYIGYPLTWQLLEEGHIVLGIDNLSRRNRVADLGSDSLTPILSSFERRKLFKSNYENFNNEVDITLGRDSSVYLKNLVESFKPDAIRKSVV